MNPFFRIAAAGACLVVLTAAVLGGCAWFGARRSGLPEHPMVLLTPDSYPRFSDDLAFDNLPQAIEQSLSYLEALPADRSFSFAGDLVSRDRLIDSLLSFRAFIATRPSPEALNRHVAAHYAVYQSRGGDGNGRALFTGYYAPLLAGSLIETPSFPYPVYGVPDDLVVVEPARFPSLSAGERIVGRVENGRLVPYFDRAAIDFEGKLDGRATPIAWVGDRVGLFFLHVQGSGKICMENGRTLQVHYHGTNGHPYRSIGKRLLEEGHIPREQMSMQAIRAYLDAHPASMQEVLGCNPSYVFFKVETDGPLGCLGRKVTPGRSIAVDRRVFPMAGLSFIHTEKPLVDADGVIRHWAGCRRFVLAQDTGGAIRGPGRVDLFWGEGPYAQIAAGHMKHPGKLYFLVKKSR